MPFPYNGSGIEVRSGPKAMPPAGDYVLRITKAVAGLTGAGDDKVVANLEIAEGEHALFSISYHNVTFFKDKTKKGAGMALHFLKCIGEPCEGEFAVDEGNWVGKKLMGHVEYETVKEGKHKGKTFPRIKWVDPLPAADEVPF